MARFVITLTALLVLSAKVSGQDFPGPGPGPGRIPGRMPSPEMQKEELKNIKFQYVASESLFKDEAEAKFYQALFDKNKDSKEIKNFFTIIEENRMKKMEGSPKGERGDFEKMQKDRESKKLSMMKELKSILDKFNSKESVTCINDKSPLVLEKNATDSIKDSSQAIKIVMTQEELQKMKKDLKEEVKKELMSDLAKKEKNNNGPSHERADAPKRLPEDREMPEKSREGGDREKKMAGPPPGEGRKSRPAMERGERAGGMRDSDSAPLSLSSSSFGQMQGGGLQMGQMQNSGMQMGQMQNSGMQMGQMQNYRMSNYGMQNYGMQNYGMQNYGMQNYGMQNYGMQNYGMQNYGMQMRGPRMPTNMPQGNGIGISYPQSTQLNYNMNGNYNNTQAWNGMSNVNASPFSGQAYNPYAAYYSYQNPVMGMGN